MADIIKLDTSGFDEVAKELKRLQRELPEAFAAAMYQEALAVDALAVSKIPVDTGRLRASHYVSPPQLTGGGYVVEVGFGTEYAVYVHEIEEASHTVGEHKFLEKALNQRATGYRERLAKRTRENAERGIGIRGLSGAPPRPRDPGPEWHSARKEKRQAKASARRERVKARRQAQKQAGSERKKAQREQRRTARKIRKAAREHERKVRGAERRRLRTLDRRAKRAQRHYERVQKRAAAREARSLRKKESRWKANQVRKLRRAEQRVRRQEKRAYRKRLKQVRRAEARRTKRLRQKQRHDEKRMKKAEARAKSQLARIQTPKKRTKRRRSRRKKDGG